MAEKRLQEEQVIINSAQGNLLKKIFTLSMKYWPLLLGFLAAIIATAVLDSVNTYLSRFLIDDGVIAGNREELFRYGAILLSLFAATGLSIFIFIVCAGKLAELLQYDLRKTQFEHLQQLSFSFFDKTSSGWLMSRITDDSRKIADLATWMFLDTVWGIVNIGVALIFMAFINLKLMLIVAVMMPPLLLLAVQFQKLILAQYRKVRSLNSEITSSYSENISGVRVVKALNREKLNLRLFSKKTGSMHAASFQAGWLSALFLPCVQLVTTLGVAAILWAGGRQISVGGLSAGELRAFIGYILFMLWPIQDLARVFSEMQRSIASAERVFGLLETPQEIQDQPECKTEAVFSGQIELCNVDFFYEKDSPVIENLNLSVKPGEMIALVGPTGGGKTTLVNLICRFYEPRKGTILFDGEDYRGYSQQALQGRIGVVLQDPHLFSGTVRENILFGAPDADEDKMLKASSLAQAHEMIKNLPGGYQEEVGEAGDLLSIGQKQLISLARTILSDPDIIIMDEATSSVDSLTEHQIQKGMLELLKGRTSFVIAHRLSTIREADRILVIGNGTIREEGTHRKLLQNRDYYYKLYTSQIRMEGEKSFGMV
jgi:ATP-binding cassette, subfamily B, bacterial